jgi:DNA-binding MarR family transcriptional regulator
MSAHQLDRTTAERVSLGLIRVTKLMHAARQHAPRIHPAVDATAYPILFNLAAEPRRVSVLADCIHSDVSTVSRQVSTLVGHGLLEKVSDPDDGRAQVVRLSKEGQSLLAGLAQQRTEWFRTLMDTWTAEEAIGFAACLERFGEALEASREHPFAARPPEPSITTSTTTSPEN